MVVSALAAWASPAARPAHALGCESVTFEDTPYSICRVDMERDDLRLFLDAEDGERYGQFSRIDALLSHEGKRLGFAMNAGMYHEDRAPVGLYVEDGQEVMRAIPNPGPGNFGLLPNGVFCFGDGEARVIETLRYLDEGPECRFATQSGPMLVIDGELHPRFLPDSTSRYIRNGVGTTGDSKTAIFAISDRPVTFHAFGRFFRDGLGLDQALFLDGNVSRLYAPELGRSDIGRWLGPIVGVVTETE
ncbi:phosphodiester glycosidase family protein [Litorisediminicola beolgyonensis]|uniref:Phosphodiester glycosidase family protein n=1 Tax=Litorisediminicola beolgyonensis TaxID=1173614 RepID=A0ABW3ZG05_9RHOB